MTSMTNFADFRVGEVIFFEKSFDPSEFDAFATLSGDRNPLHHDDAYAAQSEFGRPIVPMHLAIAPFSRIAGMMFPGDPSLYLSHEVRSIAPVFYGEKLIYSAKIISLNQALRTLTVRVLVCRGADVLISSEIRVMSRLESWKQTASVDAFKTLPIGTALITGATGAIGSALAWSLAKRGWNLALVDRGPGQKRDALWDKLDELGGDDISVDFLAADLLVPGDVADLCEALRLRGDIQAVLHVASPPVDAGIADLVQVNYTALHQITSAVLPDMLVRQNGSIIAVSSIATERVISGWRDYSAAKAMVGQFLTGFDNVNSEFGVRGLTVLSGLVATPYSASVQGQVSAMLPQELAEAIVESALEKRLGEALILECNVQRAGKLGFHTRTDVSATRPSTGVTSSVEETVSGSKGEPDVKDKVADVVRSKLRIPGDVSLAGGGLGISPGWDSLRHIELVLELETAFGVRFSAADIEKMLTFDALVSTVSACLKQ